MLHELELKEVLGLLLELAEVEAHHVGKGRDHGQVEASGVLLDRDRTLGRSDRASVVAFHTMELLAVAEQVVEMDVALISQNQGVLVAAIVELVIDHCFNDIGV